MYTTTHVGGSMLLYFSNNNFTNIQENQFHEKKFDELSADVTRANKTFKECNFHEKDTNREISEI